MAVWKRSLTGRGTFDPVSFTATWLCQLVRPAITSLPRLLWALHWLFWKGLEAIPNVSMSWTFPENGGPFIWRFFDFLCCPFFCVFDHFPVLRIPYRTFRWCRYVRLDFWVTLSSRWAVRYAPFPVQCPAMLMFLKKDLFFHSFDQLSTEPSG